MPSVDDLPQDEAGALQMLQFAASKDTALCQYPPCTNEKRPPSGRKKPSYCAEHEPVDYSRAMAYLKRKAGVSPAGVPASKKSGSPPTLEASYATLAQLVQQLRTELEFYTELWTDLSDPNVVSAQRQAERSAIDAEIAEARRLADQERLQRTAAENAAVSAEEAARAAQEAANAQRDVAIEAIKRAGEAEARYVDLEEETRERIAAVEQERDETIKRMRADLDAEREQIERASADRAIEMQILVDNAQRSAREASQHAQDVETEARLKVESAAARVEVAEEALKVERAEVQRLRNQLVADAIIARDDLQRLRDRHDEELKTIRADFSAERETQRQLASSQVEQIVDLKTQLASEQKRADDLVAENEKLRASSAEKKSGRKTVEEKDK